MCNINPAGSWARVTVPSRWGASSVGRALRSQRRGRGFNSRALHHNYFTWHQPHQPRHSPRTVRPSDSAPPHSHVGWSTISFPSSSCSVRRVHDSPGVESHVASSSSIALKRPDVFGRSTEVSALVCPEHAPGADRGLPRLSPVPPSCSREDTGLDGRHDVGDLPLHLLEPRRRVWPGPGSGSCRAGRKSSASSL